MLFLIEAVVDIENLAMAEHLDLMMHYKAENLLLFPDTAALVAMVPADVVEAEPEHDLANDAIHVIQDIRTPSFGGCPMLQSSKQSTASHTWRGRDW